VRLRPAHVRGELEGTGHASRLRTRRLHCRRAKRIRDARAERRTSRWTTRSRRRLRAGQGELLHLLCDVLR